MTKAFGRSDFFEKFSLDLICLQNPRILYLLFGRLFEAQIQLTFNGAEFDAQIKLRFISDSKVRNLRSEIKMDGWM